MLPEMTPAVERALAVAQRLVRGRAAGAMDPSDVLQGLLREEEGQAASLLRKAGVDPRRSRDAAEAEGDTPVPFSSSTQAALELARDAAPDRVVDSGHLLMALVSVDAALLQSLQSLGFDPAALKVESTTTEATPPIPVSFVLTEAADDLSAGRVIDANNSRAREGLRVVEDYCRFVLDDAFLSGELKHLRHDLTSIVGTLLPTAQLAARDVQRDVGTSISTSQEYHRPSLQAIVQANCKRLQEALRSLEEFAKLHDARAAQSLEQMRYRAYTLEAAIWLGNTARERLADARLYALVGGDRCGAALDWTVREMAAGGVQVIQMREKGLSDRALLERARHMRRWTRDAGVLFIVNDRPDIARLADADGVHLGRDDMAVADARRILGPDALIGVSTHDLAQLRRAILDGASYLGVGPTFPSRTKEFSEFPGLDFVRQATAETSLPLFALGGVTSETIDAALAAGACRVAVGDALCGADDPRAVATELRRRLAAGTMA